MRNWMHRLTIVFIITAAAALLSACQQSEHTIAANTTGQSGQEADLKVINIGFPSTGNDWAGGLLGVAKTSGYLEEYLNPLGYTAKCSGFVGAAPAIHEALVAEDLDYVVYAGMAGILAKSNQVPTSLLAVTGYTSSWRLVVAADSGIESIADLAGKSIAYQRGASPQMYLLRVLSEAGIEFAQVEAVNMTLPDGLSSVATGSIDAAVVSAGQEAKLVEEGKAVVIHMGFEADPSIFYEPTVLIARTAAVESDEAAAAAIIKALLKAKDQIAADPQAYYQLSADQSGNPLAVILATAEDNTDIAFPMNLDDKYIAALQEIQTLLTDHDLITGTVDFAEWANTAILNTAVEEYQNEPR